MRSDIVTRIPTPHPLHRAWAAGASRVAAVVGIGLLALASRAPAANWYVRSGGAGSQTGSDWNNAWALGGINWPSVQPGDTVWLAGGNYSDSLHIQKSGSAGNYIYIKRVRATDAAPTSAAGWNSAFDSQAIVAPPNALPCYWDAGGGLGSYVYIDGRLDSGIRFQLANLSGFAYPAAVYFGPSVNGTHHVTLTNLDLTGPVPAGTLSYSAGSYLCGLTFRGGPSGGGGIYVTDITVSGCRIHSAIDLVLLVGVQRAVFDHCKFYDAPFDSGPLQCHPNVTEWAFSGDITYRYCEFWNWYSEGIMMGSSYDPDPNPYGAAYLYGNIFRDPNNGSYSARVIEARWKTQTVYFYNNTCVNFSGNPYVFGAVPGNGQWSPTSQCRNNIYWNSQISLAPADLDYEFSSGVVAGAHSISSGVNPFVNLAGKDFHISSAMAANLPRNKGVALAALYNLDFDQTLRGSDGAWDIGAFEYGGVASTNPIISVSPAALSFGPVATNVTLTNVLTVQNLGAGTLAGTATVSAPFSIAYGGSYSLGPNQSQTVGIRYRPVSTSDSGSVIFTGGGGTSVSVSGQLIAMLPGLTFDSFAGAITPPFVNGGGFISQPVETGVADGGSAIYAFTITNAGSYVVQASVNAPSLAENSLFLNMDGQPTDPTMIWDIPVTAGLEPHTASWRGNGTPDANEFTPKVFDLAVGAHQLIIRGREANVQLGRISILKLPPAPRNLRVAGN